MLDLFVESFVEKLILLEQRTGARIPYRLMNSFGMIFYDAISLQKVAKAIADFIGLTGFTFVITTSKQKENTGGHIDLRDTRNFVFIEIDESTMKFPNVVAGILCHELCHKWLQVNGINCPTDIENEILTDITTVFLGLGKIMLNGCKGVNVKQGMTLNGTSTTTQTITSGYLDRDHLSLVYRLVCAMRKTPKSEYMQGLNSEATDSIRNCDKTLGQHYSDRLYRAEARQESVGSFCEIIITLQKEMVELDKKLTYIKKSCCETMDGFLNQSHKKLSVFRQKAMAMIEKQELDPALSFLTGIDNTFELERMKQELRAVKRDTSRLLGHANALGLRIYRNSDAFPSPAPNMFDIVTCRQDGTKLRLPQQSGDLIAICPKCRYRFPYDTTSVSFSKSLGVRLITFVLRPWEGLMKRNRNGKTEESPGFTDNETKREGSTERIIACPWCGTENRVPFSSSDKEAKCRKCGSYLFLQQQEEQPEIDRENVTLCGDGTCIGIIDSSGRCRKCGKTYEEGIAADKSKAERSKQQ